MNIKLDYKKVVLCIVTGLLVACAFPKINLFFLIWIAFVPLLFVTMESSLKDSLLYGFFSGFIFNIVGLYWLVPMLEFNTGSFVQTIFVSCILWTYLASYWGVWCLFLSLLKNMMDEKIKYVVSRNIFIVFLGASMWVVLEYVKTYLLTGFPWMLVGYSQFEFVEVIQIAEFTGVYGISFLVIFCNLCFYFWILTNRNNKYLYVALFIIIALVLFGAFRSNRFKFFGTKEFSVSVVQPNIEQYKKWNKFYKYEILAELKKYASYIAENKTDLVLWPETVFAGFIFDDIKLYNNAKSITSIAGGFNIFGSIYNDEKYRSYNVVLPFEDGDDYRIIHKKNHIVPFGEFIPFRFFSNFFSALKQMRDFKKGNDTNVFDNGKISVGSTICSENFFPNISRRFVLSGAKVLTSHTNDAWFFDTAMPYQHFIMNVFRAVENRKTVIISANSGISGIIDASGEIIDSTLISKRVLLSGVFYQNDFKTFYTKYGDLFAYICIGLTFVAIGFIIASMFCRIR
jgi:apolipoprotein N-acyltransferase